MSVEIKLLRNPYALVLRIEGGAQSEDTQRLTKFLSMLEELPTGILLDWSKHDRVSAAGLEVLPELRANWTPAKIAVLATSEKENTIALIVQRKLPSTEVCRFEIDQEDAARVWLGE